MIIPCLYCSTVYPIHNHTVYLLGHISSSYCKCTKNGYITCYIVPKQIARRNSILGFYLL